MKNDHAEETLDILKNVGAIITDSHLVYTSGRHGDIYVNKDILYTYTTETSKIGRFFAELHKDLPVEVVAGPSMGGIILAQWTAYHLTQLKKKEIYAVYTEKTPDKEQIFKRGYDRVVKGKNVLVVEDLTTTGMSAKKVVDSIKNAGGNVIAASVMVNRRPDRVNSDVIGVPFTSLATLATHDFDKSECPFCRERRPINTQVGHGKEYLAKKRI